MSRNDREWTVQMIDKSRPLGWIDIYWTDDPNAAWAFSRAISLRLHWGTRIRPSRDLIKEDRDRDYAGKD